MVENKDNLNKINIPMMLMTALAIIGAAGFAALTYNIAVHGMMLFDDPVRTVVYDTRNPGLTTFAELITYAGQWPVIVVLCLLLLIYPKTRFSYGVPVAAAAVLTQILEKTIKHIVCRPRPEVSLRLIEESGYSFPSGHSVTSMAVYLLLFILIMSYMKSSGKKNALLILTLFLSFAVGLSRVYLGVHFPSDVLAGWCGAWLMIAVVLIIRDNTKIGQMYMTPGEDRI